MNRSALLGLLALAGMGLSAQAADNVLQPRIGIAAAFGSFKGDESPSGALPHNFIDDNAVGFKAYGQYPLNSWFAVEGAYHYTQNFKDKINNDLGRGQIKLSFDGWSVQGLVYIPTTIEDFQAYVKAGYYNFDDELVLNGSNLATSSERGLVGGAGALLKIADNVALRLDIDWFDADVGDLSSVNIGVEYHFGSSAN